MRLDFHRKSTLLLKRERGTVRWRGYNTPMPEISGGYFSLKTAHDSAKEHADLIGTA